MEIVENRTVHCVIQHTQQLGGRPRFRDLAREQFGTLPLAPCIFFGAAGLSPLLLPPPCLFPGTALPRRRSWTKHGTTPFMAGWGRAAGLKTQPRPSATNHFHETVSTPKKREEAANNLILPTMAKPHARRPSAPGCRLPLSLRWRHGGKSPRLFRPDHGQQTEAPAARSCWCVRKGGGTQQDGARSPHGSTASPQPT